MLNSQMALWEVFEYFQEKCSVSLDWSQVSGVYIVSKGVYV